MELDLEKFYLQLKIEEYVSEHANIVNTIKTFSQVYLVGGTIRDLILNKEAKNLDFIVIGNNNKPLILDVFNNFNVNYKMNKMDGYKFTYVDREINIWTTEDLFSNIEYNVDGLFYDLNNSKLISLTFNDFKENGLRIVNDVNSNSNSNRLIKLKRFEKEYLKNE